MSDTIIQAENLGKKYILRHKPKEPYTALRDVITQKAVSLGHNIFHPTKRRQENKSREEFWALKNVGFKIKRGEVLGIIGPNGAGKSTLLKILSRITHPTSGRIRIVGRIASLLEVGTGFHPELTGRENIYLNGAILGMPKAEISRKFDEIVAFSEVEKFLDTPVKRYSSGMYVRLAFAVAAHLEPEILLVDEVLAVGDAAFQKKCLGKMGAVSREGRTVFLVSHNMTAIENLCTNAFLLDKGELILADKPGIVINHYMGKVSGVEFNGEINWKDPMTAPGNEIVRLKSIRLVDESGNLIRTVKTDQKFGIQIEFDTLKEGEIFNVGLYLFNKEDIQIFTSLDNNDSWHEKPRPSGIYKTTCYIPPNILSPGVLKATVQIKRIKPKPARLHFRIPDALVFNLNDSGAVQGNIYNEFLGVVRPLLEWQTDFKPGL